MNEYEIRNWLYRERERHIALEDPVERACCLVAIATLEGVLND